MTRTNQRHRRAAAARAQAQAFADAARNGDTEALGKALAAGTQPYSQLQPVPSAPWFLSERIQRSLEYAGAL